MVLFLCRKLKLFICNRYGCKVWLQSIQNYTWHCFQAFAHCHLKQLSCSIWIWEDTISSDRSLIQTCCFAQDLIRNMWFCSYIIFLLRDKWMIERFSKVIGCCLGWQQLLAHSMEISCHMKKKWLVTALNLQSIETLLALELTQIQYRKSGSVFSSSESVAASKDCSRLGNALCLRLPILPVQAEQKSWPKSLAVDFAL